jgi:hypothetical protein
MRKEFSTRRRFLALCWRRLWRGPGVYQDGDVLLIFRENGFDDVEFDLGNISQFLNQPNGYHQHGRRMGRDPGPQHIWHGFDRA